MILVEEHEMDVVKLVILPEESCRIEAIITMIVSTIIGARAFVCPFSSRRSIRWFSCVSALVVFMLSIVYVVFPTSSAREDARDELKKRFALFWNPNALSFYARQPAASATRWLLAGGFG